MFKHTFCSTKKRFLHLVNFSVKTVVNRSHYSLIEKPFHDREIYFYRTLAFFLLGLADY